MEQNQLVTLSLQEAVALGAENLIDYGRIFFPKTIRQASPDFHYEVSDALLGPDRQVGIEIFRDGAKTTLLRLFLSQRIAYAVSRTILVVSASQGHSILSLRWIKRQVETNGKWANTFQLKKGSKWTDEVIEIAHGIEDCTITIMALGITGQLRGFNIDDYRPDFILADDVSTDEMTKTLEQRKKFEDLFFGALLNSLAPASEAPLAKIVLLDTPKNKGDLIESCRDRADWKFLCYGILDENNRSRWESRYPTEEVLKAKEAFVRSGQVTLWLKEKECKIVSSELASFNPDNLLYYDEYPSNMMVVLSIDPASSDNPNADDQVLMAIGFKGADVYVLDYSAEKGEMPDKLCVTLFEYIRRFRPVAIVSESVAYQRVLAWYIEKEMREKKTYVPVHREQDKRNKADRIVQQLGGLSAFGKLHVRAKQTGLINQYTEYSPLYKGHDDIIDALAMGCFWAETKGIASYIEGEYSVVEDESEYKSLEFRSCP
jgi:hypothetical protein